VLLPDPVRPLPHTQCARIRAAGESAGTVEGGEGFAGGIGPRRIGRRLVFRSYYLRRARCLGSIPHCYRQALQNTRKFGKRAPPPHLEEVCDLDVQGISLDSPGNLDQQPAIPGNSSKFRHNLRLGEELFWPHSGSVGVIQI